MKKLCLSVLFFQVVQGSELSVLAALLATDMDFEQINPLYKETSVQSRDVRAGLELKPGVLGRFDRQSHKQVKPASAFNSPVQSKRKLSVPDGSNSPRRSRAVSLVQQSSADEMRGVPESTLESHSEVSTLEAHSPRESREIHSSSATDRVSMSVLESPEYADVDAAAGAIVLPAQFVTAGLDEDTDQSIDAVDNELEVQDPVESFFDRTDGSDLQVRFASEVVTDKSVSPEQIERAIIAIKVQMPSFGTTQEKITILQDKQEQLKKILYQLKRLKHELSSELEQKMLDIHLIETECLDAHALHEDLLITDTKTGAQCVYTPEHAVQDLRNMALRIKREIVKLKSIESSLYNKKIEVLQKNIKQLNTMLLTEIEQREDALDAQREKYKAQRSWKQWLADVWYGHDGVDDLRRRHSLISRKKTHDELITQDLGLHPSLRILDVDDV